MDEQNNNTSDDQTEDKFKYFLQIYQIYRDHVKHEDTLGNQRLTFFIASQSLLFIPYFTILKDYQFYSVDTVLLIVICALGWWISDLVEPSIQGFVSASHNINSIWKQEHLEKLTNKAFVECYSYNEQKSQIEEISRNKIKNSENLSFFKINQKIIPNIRYENNEPKLRDSMNFKTNKIPFRFKQIWMLLLFFSIILPVINCTLSELHLQKNYTQTIKIEFSKEFKKNIENILNQNAPDFLNKLQQEFKNKEQQGFEEG
ncbi:MAG: hypothetical protein QNJ32_12110 [Xenococcaceae cyanobacterium MO_167.B27]|nr:hypothetical protein [Xenococcaceae cyanobacterium MO_167.B27]